MVARGSSALKFCLPGRDRCQRAGALCSIHTVQNVARRDSGPRAPRERVHGGSEQCEYCAAPQATIISRGGARLTTRLFAATH
jgi:hypothetical protein